MKLPNRLASAKRAPRSRPCVARLRRLDGRSTARGVTAQQLGSCRRGLKRVRVEEDNKIAVRDTGNDLRLDSYCHRGNFTSRRKSVSSAKIARTEAQLANCRRQVSWTYIVTESLMEMIERTWSSIHGWRRNSIHRAIYMMVLAHKGPRLAAILSRLEPLRKA